MAIGKITKRKVDTLTCNGKTQYLWDSELKGFGIKVTANGSKIFLVQYRIGGRASKTKRYTIGKNGTWTPDKARKEAEELLSLADKGIDPYKSKIDKQRQLSETNFESVAKDFIEKYAKTHNRSWPEVERIFNLDIIPAFKGRSILTITRKDTVSLIDSVAKRGEILANRVFAHLRKLLNWCVERGILEASPIAGMRPPYMEIKRDRVLNGEEIKLVWGAAAQLGWPFASWVKLLLLTGQRRNEVAEMRWQDIDMEKKLWTIPSSLTKNGKSHEVPLSNLAYEVLANIQKYNSKHLVFSTNQITSISGFSRAKCRIDALIKALEKEGGVDSLPSWCWHDLRRTAATKIASLGFPPHVVEAVLNHKSGVISGIAAVYNHFDYANEKREALEAWANYMNEFIINPVNSLSL